MVFLCPCFLSARLCFLCRNDVCLPPFGAARSDGLACKLLTARGQAHAEHMRDNLHVCPDFKECVKLAAKDAVHLRRYVHTDRFPRFCEHVQNCKHVDGGVRSRFPALFSRVFLPREISLFARSLARSSIRTRRATSAATGSSAATSSRRAPRRICTCVAFCTRAPTDSAAPRLVLLARMRWF